MLRGQTCCQLCFLLHFVYCGNTALSGTFCIRRGQLSVPAPRCLIPETSDRSFRYHTVPSFSQWLTHSGPALITLTPFFFFHLSFGIHFLFFSLGAWSNSLCFSNEAFDLSFRGLLFRSLLQEAKCQVCTGGCCVQLDRAPLGHRARRLSIWSSNPFVFREH